MARLLGLRVSKCEVYDSPQIRRSLERDDVIQGTTRCQSALALVKDHNDNALSMGGLAADCLMRLAGPAGSRRVGECSGGGNDYRQLYEPLALAYDTGFFTDADEATEFSADIARLEHLADDVISDNWDAIRRVAGHLMQHGRVSPEKLDQLIWSP
jgi:hypothetical protein